MVKNLYINAATAMLLLMLAFGATAGGEFVREGARKPFSIRQVLYSNSIEPDQVAKMREVGCLADDPYPLRTNRTFPNDQLVMGAKVFRRQCAVCHTVEGANGLSHLTGPWDLDQMRMNIAKLQKTKPFMPPFAGNAQELEALVQFIAWTNSGHESEWPASDDPETLSQINKWLEQAGTQPGNYEQYRHLVGETQ